jgi:hypothetical protein
MYTKNESQQRREIRDRLKGDPTLSEKQRGKLRSDLQQLRETARTREKENAAVTQAAKEAKAIKETKPPQREDFPSDKEWRTATELFRLDLLEKSCQRKLDSPRTSFSGLQNAGRELRKIEKRRAKLLPPPPEETGKTDDKIHAESFLDQLWNPNQSVESLFNSRNVAACFFGEHSAPTKGVEYELEQRNVDWRFWCLPIVKGSSSLMHLYPNRAAAERLKEEIKRNRHEKTVMNTSPSPNTASPSGRPAPPPTPAQKESREHWTNQHGSWEDKKTPVAVMPPPAVQPRRDTAYRLPDGFVFWADGTRAEELPAGTRVFPLSPPPHYIRDSGVITGWQINESFMVWVPRISNA